MLLICYAVRNGLKVMGHETIQGDCLYLGLEDSKRRLKDREKKLGLNNLTPPYVDVTAPYLDMGLEESLQNWIDSVPNPRLICIDTLARVKSRTGFNKAGTAYDHDNETLRNIQKLAIQNGVSIVLVSHLNKAPQDYAFDKITGSTGLQGICDAMWLIERGEHGAQSTFIGRGRDIMDFEYALNWNQETWRYDWVGNLQEVNLNDNRKEVIDAMRELEKTGLLEIRPRDVVKHCGYTPQSKDAHRISKTMLRMKNNFELTKGDKFGTYKLVEVNQPNY
jgi:RecA-family ATPase